MGKKTSKNLFYKAKFDGSILEYRMAFFPARFARLFGYTTYLEIPLNTTMKYTYDKYFVFCSFTVSLWKYHLSPGKELKSRKVKVWFFTWDKFKSVLASSLLDILRLNSNKQNIGLIMVKDQAAKIAHKQLKVHLSARGLSTDPGKVNSGRVNSGRVQELSRSKTQKFQETPGISPALNGYSAPGGV